MDHQEGILPYEYIATFPALGIAPAINAFVLMSEEKVSVFKFPGGEDLTHYSLTKCYLLWHRTLLGDWYELVSASEVLGCICRAILGTIPQITWTRMISAQTANWLQGKVRWIKVRQVFPLLTSGDAIFVVTDGKAPAGWDNTHFIRLNMSEDQWEFEGDDLDTVLRKIADEMNAVPA